MFSTNKPISVGKLGGIEASHIQNYLHTGEANLVRGSSLFINAGIYCPNRQSLNAWCDQYIDAVRDLDYVLRWCPEQGDDYVIDAVGSGKTLTDFNQIEPFTHGSSGWHYQLSGKKVLVISQLAETILQQATKYSNIWPGAEIGSVVVRGVGYSEALTGLTPIDWRIKMDDLKKQISKLEFDFAVVGCGGFSLEICRFIKAEGKSVVHLGGATQLLFGIRGARWDGCFKDSVWYGNEKWVYPLEKETPIYKNLVEGGCYW